MTLRAPAMFVALAWFALPHPAVRAADHNALRMAMESVTSGEIRTHVEFLANDTLEGREGGSRGGHAAAGFLVEQLKKYGVRPLGTQGYYQPFGSQHRNILCVIDGSDPALRDEVIVVGAHYDHVGYGNRSNSYGPIGHIHNGADDNASGVSGLMEIIQALSIMSPAPRRTIVLALWDAEEKGLLGSRYWARNPTVDRARIKLAINADMIGRLRDEKLYIYGTRTAAGMRQLISQANSEYAGLRITCPWEMREDSDHYSFYEQRLPTLMFHTGLHEDYHRPSDDLEKIECDGVARTARAILGVTITAADADTLPGFRTKAATDTAARQKEFEKPLPPLPGRLGIVWDMQDMEQPGLRVAEVVTNSTAARAGLQPNDRIRQFGEHVIGPRTDLRTLALAAESPVRLLISRPGTPDPIELSVELQGPPVRIGISWREDDAEPGVVILARIVPGSVADHAGLRVMDRVELVGGQSFAGGREFAERVQGAEGNIELMIDRDGVRQTMVLQVDGTGPDETSL